MKHLVDLGSTTEEYIDSNKNHIILDLLSTIYTSMKSLLNIFGVDVSSY